jgi:DNA ligase-1
MITKPMLAVAAEDLEKIVFPVLCSPKLDGIRALKINGKLLSRSFKPIPNDFIRTMVEHVLPDGVDGELLVGHTFHESSSGVMSQDGQPNFQYAMFDYVAGALNKPFIDRLADLKAMLESSSLMGKHFTIVSHTIVSCVNDLIALEQQMVDQGYEGLMIRSLRGPYKCGRSTAKEGYLLKLKRFEDSEAIILDYEEQMHNTNEAKKDVLGRTERSTAKDGLIPKGVLGTIIVRDIHSGVEFKIGTGFDDIQRAKFWKERSSLPGRLVKYKYQPSGVKEAPRFPTFLSLRHQDDL